jgi:hypothetical protein
MTVKKIAARWMRARADRLSEESLWTTPMPFSGTVGESFIQAGPAARFVAGRLPDRPMTPDEARWFGVRLIEAATLADDGRSVDRP